MKQIHPFGPVFDSNSKVLILGSFPSVKSRENNFYYGHPQNRFWHMISLIYGCEKPKTIDEKKSLLLSHSIALWDVIQSCEVVGSSDSSIKNVIPNNLNIIILKCDIMQIYANGKTTEKLYMKYIEPVIGRSIIALPSTSPANAAWSIDRLIEAWSCIKDINKKE
jgi:hypoxanthine-DNA glycosylase